MALDFTHRTQFLVNRHFSTVEKLRLSRGYFYRFRKFKYLPYLKGLLLGTIDFFSYKTGASILKGGNNKIIILFLGTCIFKITKI